MESGSLGSNPRVLYHLLINGVLLGTSVTLENSAPQSVKYRQKPFPHKVVTQITVNDACKEPGHSSLHIRSTGTISVHGYLCERTCAFSGVSLCSD